MTQLTALIEQMQSRDDCRVTPPAGRPLIPAGFRLPADLEEFYSRCEKADLFGMSFEGEFIGASCRILPADELVTIHEAVMGEESTGIEKTWYAVADVQDGNYIGIDLKPEKLGLCYDCFHETIGVPGYCKVIAQSFTELLEQFLKHGDSSWWLREQFTGYGDAYD